MDIVRNADGTLVVPVHPGTAPRGDDDGAAVRRMRRRGRRHGSTASSHHAVLHPGEGGYDEALSRGISSRTPIASRPSRR